MPTPRPDKSVTRDAVEKPGAKMSSHDLIVGHGVDASCRSDTACPRDLADPGDVDAAAVVLDFDHDPVALPCGAQTDRRGWGLARGPAFVGAFDAMIQGIAQDMEQRLGDCLDDALVGLRGGALDHQPHRLADRRGHLAGEAREALKGVMKRKDTETEHRLLQLGDQPLKQQVLVLQGYGKLARITFFLSALRGMADGVLGNQQLTGQPDQSLDPFDIDPQGRVGRLGR